jgi:aspartyl-tRNA(Asn)/glutamyl-tRNA(Gln) amidotransferase subunit B
LRTGNTIEQETRGWVEDRGVTVSQRTKEQAHDYRYFPEPDLPPLAVVAEAVDALRARLPEMPAVRRDRFVSEYGIKIAEASQLTVEREIADYFETVAGGVGKDRPRAAANWIINDLTGLQRTRELPPERLPLTTSQLKDLLDALDDGKLTGRAAKELLPLLQEGDSVLDAAAKNDLLVLDEEDAIRSAVLETMAATPAAVADFRGGKTAAIGRLIGETIRRTGGRANPDQVRRILEQELSGEVSKVSR